MACDQYIYAVARIRTKELALLNKPFFEQLLACKHYEDCMRLLRDKGWGKTGNETISELLKVEREKIWDLMRELIGDLSPLNIFLYANDFHNLKASIKQVYINKEIPNIYIENGTITSEKICEAIKIQNFNALPEHMRACAKKAYDVLFHTGDSQLCDVIVDKKAMEIIYIMGKSSKNPLLEQYVELKALTINSGIALRSYKMEKPKSFLEKAFVECEGLDKNQLIDSYVKGKEALYDYLGSEVDVSDFEKWCDHAILALIRKEKYNPFTLSPIVAYLLARENEIKSISILLLGKLNNFKENTIRERLRETYV